MIATRALSILVALVVALLAVGTAFAENPVTIQLTAENNSGVNGTATLTPMGNQTQVVINVTGEPSGASEPDHIHVGQCGPTLGAVKYPLKNVENGTSTTVVNASLTDLSNGNMAINLHESAANIKNYTACGNIPAMTMSGSSSGSLPSSGGAPVGIVLAGAALAASAGYALRRRAG